MLAGLGETWYFPSENSFKHYPHCRAQHGLFDLLVEVLDENNIATSEITAIRAHGEGHVERALWLNSNVTDTVEAQFSIAHGMAVAAQRLTPSKEWQSDEVVYSPAVVDLARVVTYETHSEWQDAIVNEPLARPSRVEVDARGTTFVGELRYPRGTAGNADTAMSDDELAAKFRINVSGVLSDAQARSALDMLMSLDSVADVRPVLRSLAAPRGSRVVDAPAAIPTPRTEHGRRPVDEPA